jgi:hypothetical protein
MTRRVVQLREWESDHREFGLSLTDADRALARALGDGAGRLGVTELADSLRLDATAWVGVVRFSEVEIQVVPKLVGENLGVLQMLGIQAVSGRSRASMRPERWPRSGTGASLISSPCSLPRGPSGLRNRGSCTTT